jgi:predicted deacylase
LDKSAYKRLVSYEQNERFSYVSKNDLLGVICNPFGDIEHKVLSTADGYIVGINNQPVVNQGDALIHIGMEG